MFRLLLIGLFCLTTSIAHAAEALVFGPPASWAVPAEQTKAPAVSAEAKPAAVSLLLMDQQLHFGPDGDAAYQHRLSHIGTAQGLGAAGAVSVAWNPTTDTVVVHGLRILRGDQVIDVLAKQTFTVLRRETNLSQAVLDGTLTATLQPEGLQVGDTIDFAYTSTRRDPVLAGHSEGFVGMGGGAWLGRMRFRASWDSPKAMAWKASDPLGKPQVRTSRGATDISLDLRDQEKLEGPSGAPRRFQPRREIEFSDFGGWAEVSSLLAPYYVAASRLKPDSPLRAEAAKIRAASSDPKAQASAALKLVQEQVRYVALLMPDGGYTPVDADTTWQRRFGDCKAKSVLLVALLTELGFKAAAAAVNAYGADGLDKRLPRVSAFNHVIARVEIGERVYWLDGTRSGDGPIDTIQMPRFDWALPLRVSGGALEELRLVALDTPEQDARLIVDASDGVLAPVKLHAELKMGGLAAQMLSMLSALPASSRDDLTKTMWAAFPWLEVTSSKIKDDPSGAVVILEGVGKLKWVGFGFEPTLFISNANLTGPSGFERKPGPGADAPFAVSFPSYTRFNLSMTVPKDRATFAVPAPDVDLTAAGRAYWRRSRADGDTITIETTQRSLVREFPASEGPAAAKAIGDMAKVRVGLRVSKNYVPTGADVKALLAAKPTTTAQFVERGGLLTLARRYDEALKDFDEAIRLAPEPDPNSPDTADAAARDRAFGYANRGWLHHARDEWDLARADYDRALALDPRNYVALQNLGGMALREGRYADAIALFNRVTDVSPRNVFALMQRSQAYRLSGAYDLALADIDRAARIDPTIDVNFERIYVRRAAGDNDATIAAIDAALVKKPRSEQLYVLRGAINALRGRDADAFKDFEASLAIKPTAEAYLTRARYRARSDLAGKLDDIAKAEALSPEGFGTPMTRADALSDAGRHAEALAVLDKAVRARGKDLPLQIAQAEALVRAGRAAEGLQSFAAVRQKIGADASLLNNLCWTQATLNVALEDALKDCEASLRLTPRSAPTIDSHAFVLLRLGRFAEALPRYDEAVKLRPHEAASRYGRGLTLLRLNRVAEGEAELAAAGAISSRVADQFSGYGLAGPRPAASTALRP